MCLTVTPLTVIILQSADGADTRFWLILISLVVGAIMLVAICWDIVNAWIKRTRGRNWPTVSAVINIVSVAFMENDMPGMMASTNQPNYKAMLTYIYHYPEEQMGDYSREFGSKEDADAWANSYKGETVKVHVDPRDSTRSVLREEDI